jgi:hypothetical protein
MGKLIAILEIVAISLVNLVVMYGAALLAITGDGGGRGMSTVFGVGCFFIASFALVDFVRVIEGQDSTLSFKAVPTAIGVLLVYVIGGSVIGIKQW